MATATAAQAGAKDAVAERLAEIEREMARQREENEAQKAEIAALKANAGRTEGTMKVMGLGAGGPKSREQVAAFLAKPLPKTLFFCKPAGCTLDAIKNHKNYDPKTGTAEQVKGAYLQFRPYKGEGAELVETHENAVRPRLRWGFCDVAQIDNVVPDDREPRLGEYTQSQVIEAVQRSGSFTNGRIFSSEKAQRLIALEYEDVFREQDRLKISQEREAIAAPGELKTGRAAA